MATHFKFAIVVTLAALAFAPVAAQQASGPKQKNRVEPKKMETGGGWIPLFDGQTLNGWRGYKKPDASGARWKVVDGLLTIDSSGAGDTHGQRDLITDATFDQFDLRWEW